MIKPTVGRVMWYYKYAGGAGLNKGPLAALVAFVHSDSRVNLAVADENGNMRSETSVPVVQEGEAIPPCSYCTWMPYQIGQAKKEST
jgi:hypothetical protein